MILWRISKFFTFYHFDFDPRFPPFLLYVRWKSRVTFVRRCFRDEVKSSYPIGVRLTKDEESGLHDGCYVGNVRHIVPKCYIIHACVGKISMMVKYVRLKLLAASRQNLSSGFPTRSDTN